MNIWMHRISYHMEVASPLLSAGYLTIGFSDFLDIEDFINSAIQRGMTMIDEACAAYWPKNPQSRTRHNLRRFVCEMKKGDWVVVPKWDNFDIYEIIGEKPQIISELPADSIHDWHKRPVTLGNDGYLYRDNGELIDLGFMWRVKPVRLLLSRYKFADAALTARMKHRGTNISISDLRQSVETAVSAFDANRPVDLYNSLAEATVRAVLSVIRKELNDAKFERLVKWYLERVGASEAEIPAKNERNKEGDADVVAAFDFIKTAIYVQAKFHSGTTDKWSVEQIVSYRNSEAGTTFADGYSQVCWVITSADKFSDAAVELASINKVQLINGEQFANMLLQAGFTGLDTALDR